MKIKDRERSQNISIINTMILLPKKDGVLDIFEKDDK